MLSGLRPQSTFLPFTLSLTDMINFDLLIIKKLFLSLLIFSKTIFDNKLTVLNYLCTLT